MRLFFFFIAAALLVAESHPLPIYSSGSPVLDGVEATEFVLADNFTLSHDSAIRAMRFWTIEDGVWDGTLNWFIFSDSPNGPFHEGPDKILYSGTGSNVQRSETGRSSSIYDESEWTFDFGTELYLNAGTQYWIGLHLSANFDRDHLYWSDNGQYPGGYSLRSANGTLNNWVATAGYDLAFSLHDSSLAVPEGGPSGVLLLAGCGALYLLKHRKLLPVKFLMVQVARFSRIAVGATGFGKSRGFKGAFLPGSGCGLRIFGRQRTSGAGKCVLGANPLEIRLL